MLKNLNFLTKNETTIREVNEFLSEWFSADPEITVQTSGSTGNPKLITFTKEQLKASAQNTIETFNIPKGGKSLLCLSIYTIAGKLMVVRSIVNEMELFVSDISSSSLCTPFLPSFDLAAVVPLQLQYALDQSSKLPPIKTLLVGGGQVSDTMSKQLSEHRLTAYHTYGMTETLTHVAYRRIGAIHEKYFTPLKGIKLDEKDSRLLITYPGIGVFDLQTNDLVEFTPDGKFRILGRSDHIINSGGKKFNPEELEGMLVSIIPVPYFIYGMPDEILGEKIVLVCESNSFRLEEELIQKINAVLPTHAKPKEVIYLTKFLRSKSMKILRQKTMSQH